VRENLKGDKVMNKVMKCDELKFERLGDANETYPASTLVIRKQFVDAAIDELKREHHRERDEYIDWVNKLQRENSELKAMVTTDNSAVIARLEDSLRKTQRALWHDRAIRAEHMKNLIFEGELIYHDDSGEELDWRIMYRKWERAETACRAKAKEYGEGK
jgi:hypothetical protein